MTNKKDNGKATAKANTGILHFVQDDDTWFLHDDGSLLVFV